jgi:serine/threonine-protein phosphatase 2A activator
VGPAPHHAPTAPSASEEEPACWPSPRPSSSPTSLSEIVPARKCIFTAEDLAKFNASPTFQGFVSFLRFCGAAVRGVSCKRGDSLSLSPGGRALVEGLEELDGLIDEVPPAPAALRYGNPAFREWHAKAAALSPSLLARVLEKATSTSTSSLVEAEAKALSPFLSDSLGNASRIDYGTGHETLFATLLYCLAVAGALKETDAAAVVAVVFARYVKLCRRLQTTYWLEPAGSHGVWGLDDYCFLPFYWGAAQLDDKGSESGMSGVGVAGGSGGNGETSTSTTNNDPTRDGAPSKPSGIRSDATLAEHGDAYLYLDAVRFVRTVKKGGPLSETSPMLCDIAATVPTWRRVNEGLLKMYRVEVCGKLPIMQHQLFGHLFPFSGRM